MLDGLFNIQYGRMINNSTVADQKMSNSASLVVKLSFIHIGCFSVCWGKGGGGGGGGEENLPCPTSFDLLLLKLSGHEVLLPDRPTSFKSISCQFCSSIYTFSSSLYLLTFLLLLLLLFYFLFLAFCC